MIKNIKEELFRIKEVSYKKFSASLLPGVDNVLGVRLPFLRNIAKSVSRSDFRTFFKENDDEFLELTMIEAMTIGELKLDFDIILNYVENFIPKINCWSICDTFCAGLKIIKKNKQQTKRFLEKYFNSDKEYEIRFAYVILLDYFIESDYNYVIKKLSEFNHEAYYSKMAAAWCLSICLVKNYNECINDIKTKKFHPWVLNKGIVKATESLRLSEAQKEELRKLKYSLKCEN